MKIFLAGSFRTKEEKDRLENLYNLLKDNGHEVWWAPKRVKRCYECEDSESLKKVNSIEEKAVEDSDLFVAVMEKASFGTAMEIKHAFDHNIPVIGFLLSNRPDFSSGSFKYRVRKIVKSEEELLKAIKD